MKLVNIMPQIMGAMRHDAGEGEGTDIAIQFWSGESLWEAKISLKAWKRETRKKED